MRILTVRDRSELEPNLSSLLAQSGHDVRDLEESRQGRDLLDQLAVDREVGVLVLDLDWGTSERILAELGETAKRERPSVIFMTASDRIPPSHLPLRILRKPYATEVLLELVEQALADAKRARAA